MNQNQCVPNWDLDDVGPTTQPLPPPPPTVSRSLTSRSHSASLSAGHDTSMLDYEMAELTWENGHLTMHGLGLPRASSKNNLGGAWSDSKQSPRAAGTLESIVNQATHKLPLPLTPIGACAYDDDLVPFLTSNAVHCPTVPASVSMAMDALVPTDNNRDMGVSKGVVACSTRVGSCSVAPARVPAYSADWSVSASGSERWQGVKRPAEDTCEQLRSMTNNEMTSTSFGASLDNTTRTFTVDDRDHDSVCPEREKIEEEDNHKKGAAKSISSTKRSRAAAVHNQSERKRRDKINQRMKTLQKLVPNSNKTDKASMLDEVIDYLKQLQAQIQMLNTMRLPSMMMPLAMQQQLQMSMMAPMGMGMGMGMPGMGMNPGMNMDQMNMSLNAMGRQNMPAGISPAVLNPAAYMSLAGSTDPGGDRITAQPTSMVPTDPLSTYLACQSHSITMDAYNRVAAMYQQLQQQQQQNPIQGSMPGSNR